MTYFRKNSLLSQIWPLVTSDGLNIDLTVIITGSMTEWLKYFQKYSLRAIERFFPRLSLLVSELGGGVILTPPPPTMVKVAKTTSGALVNR